jgi:hypothetical protein
MSTSRADTIAYWWTLPIILDIFSSITGICGDNQENAVLQKLVTMVGHAYTQNAVAFPLRIPESRDSNLGASN